MMADPTEGQVPMFNFSSQVPVFNFSSLALFGSAIIAVLAVAQSFPEHLTYATVKLSYFAGLWWCDYKENRSSSDFRSLRRTRDPRTV